MSYSTIIECVRDREFADRVTVAVAKEAWLNPTLGATEFAVQARVNPSSVIERMLWPVAINVEADYAANGIEGVSDGAILASIQANWPGT